MSELLHPEIFDRTPFFGGRMRESLALRAGEVAAAVATAELADPDVSIVIRSKRNPAQLEALLDDISTQEFTGERQIVLVDTDTTSDTRALAQRAGAILVKITQDEFSYPKALNKGFEVAAHPYVFSFVDHSLLSSNQTLRVATRWDATPNFAGAYGVSLPNRNATWTERVGAVALGVPKVLGSAAVRAPESAMGLLASNCSVVAKEAWEEVGGYNEAYGAGGEDGDLGKRLIAAGGVVMRDPSLSVFHTHGLGPINGARQLMAWRNMGEPAPFDRGRLEGYRPDLT